MSQQYLETLSFNSQTANDLLEDIVKYNQKRLWHQLTKQLRVFVELDEVQSILVDFYKNFICDLVGRINPFQLVEICIGFGRFFVREFWQILGLFFIENRWLKRSFNERKIPSFLFQSSKMSRPWKKLLICWIKLTLKLAVI